MAMPWGFDPMAAAAAQAAAAQAHATAAGWGGQGGGWGGAPKGAGKGGGKGGGKGPSDKVEIAPGVWKGPCYDNEAGECKRGKNCRYAHMDVHGNCTNKKELLGTDAERRGDGGGARKAVSPAHTPKKKGSKANRIRGSPVADKKEDDKEKDWADETAAIIDCAGLEDTGDYLNLKFIESKTLGANAVAMNDQKRLRYRVGLMAARPTSIYTKQQLVARRTHPESLRKGNPIGEAAAEKVNDKILSLLDELEIGEAPWTVVETKKVVEKKQEVALLEGLERLFNKQAERLEGRWGAPQAASNKGDTPASDEKKRKKARHRKTPSKAADAAGTTTPKPKVVLRSNKKKGRNLLNLFSDSEEVDEKDDESEDSDSEAEDDPLRGPSSAAVSECQTYEDAMWSKFELAMAAHNGGVRMNDAQKRAFDDANPLDGMNPQWLGPGKNASPFKGTTISMKNRKDITSFLIGNFGKEAFENGAKQVLDLVNFYAVVKSPAKRFVVALDQTYGIRLTGKVLAKPTMTIMAACIGEKIRVGAGSASA